MTSNEPYKVALVGLDLSEMDNLLIHYMAMISKILPLKQIFFVHINKETELPDELIKDYPSLLAHQDESIELDIQKKIDQYFGSSQITVSSIVKEGCSIEKILELSKIKQVDLLVMGRKSSPQGSGLVSSKIARKCPCSLLLVTQAFNAEIKNILVPTDFSKHSTLAMSLALEFAETTNAKLHTVHIYTVPIGYYNTGKTHDEFAQIMKIHAEKQYVRFLAQNDFPSDIACDFVLTDNGKYPDLTYALANKTHVDLIIIGSKGRTNLSSVLIGSVAEKLVYLDSNIPILIVKDKGENMGFLEALMKI